MVNTGTGQGGQRDGNENTGTKDQTAKKTPSEEGTNKTQPKPDPHAKRSEVPNKGKYMEKTPFVR